MKCVIKGVNRKSSGRYCCEATNKEGTSKSPPFELRVKFEPVCGEGNVRKVLGAAKDEPLRVECKVSLFISCVVASVSFDLIIRSLSMYGALNEFPKGAEYPAVGYKYFNALDCCAFFNLQKFTFNTNYSACRSLEHKNALVTFFVIFKPKRFSNNSSSFHDPSQSHSLYKWKNAN